MSDCWARVLGKCDDISREHPVSQSILKLFTGVSVEGFPWCRDGPKEVGVGSLTAKNLCRTHNSKLSNVDSAGVSFFEALGNQFEPDAPERKMRIVRHNLERWLLKTAINFNLIVGKQTEWPKQYGVGKIPPKLVKIAFGRSSFRKPAGMYVFVHPSERLDSVDRVRSTSLLDNSDVTVGFKFEFRGVPMLLWLDGTAPGKSILEGDGPLANFVYRPATLRFKPTDKPPLVVDFA
jgi:hypothetical protein